MKNSQLNLPRLMVRQCRKSLWRHKVTDGAQLLTGGALLLKSLILRRLLLRKLGGEDMVGVLLPPSAAAVLVNTAIPLMRRVPVNLNYTLSADALHSCIEQCGIKHVITSKRFMERVKLELNAKILLLEDLLPEVSWRDKAVAAASAYLAPAWLLESLLGLKQVQMDDVLTVVFTSGSTGEPKGVMLTHDNVAANIEAIQESIHIQKSDVILGALPFFHSFGFTVTLWSVLALEPMGVYHFNPLDGRGVGELCGKYGVTILISTPTFLRTYLRRCEPEQLARLDVVFTAAEKLPADLTQAFEEKFGVRPREGYGATELSPLATLNVPDHRTSNGRIGSKEGTVGRPVPNVSVKTIHPETGEDIASDQPGMLLIKGRNVMKGYLGKPELTAEVIREGWYVTGDFATIDSDGFITISGRQSRFSKIGGEMVPHIKIEETLATILGGQEQLKGIITAVPDARKGERLVVIHEPIDKSPEDVRKELAGAGLPNLWIPSSDSFLQVDAIPVLGTGKTDLKQVKALAMEKFA